MQKPRNTTQIPPASEQPRLVDSESSRVDDGVMNLRVTTLERTVDKIIERLDAIESRLDVLEKQVAVILSNYVTKEVLHRELHALTWRMFGGAALLVAAVYFIARNVAPPIYVQVSPPAQAKPQTSQTR